MGKEKISPTAIILTTLAHLFLFYLASTNFSHHHGHHSPYDIIRVSIPVSSRFQPSSEMTANIHDLVSPVENLIDPTELQQPIDTDRYYLQQELSQQVHMLYDETGSLNIPIRQIVRLSLYINESGSVDEVVIDEKGVLTDQEEDQLIQGFKKVVFLPGMRGGRVVKSILRVELKINRRITIIRN
ncbi:hypothetical protein AAKU58_003690 [Oxalobacteraceae bacterium GrIS 1.18]